MRAVQVQQIPRGTVLAGKYVVERELGAGGMGVVLAVRHRELDELYALKLMLHGAGSNAAARERFAREAKSAAKLRSEHVARAIDFGFLDDESPYMVLELLHGENLGELLVRTGPLAPESIARFMIDACDALREAHGLGIIHRDLKPTNLFVVRATNGSERVKVLDFGIAKTMATDSNGLTKTSTTMGSPLYMSPEQMRSAKKADARSDVWSLGATMFELATGRPPFIGETVTEVAISVIEDPTPTLRSIRPDISQDFEDIVMKCLRKRPEGRYATIDDLATDLAAFVGTTWTREKLARVSASSDGEASSVDTLELARTEPVASSPEAASEARSEQRTVGAEPLRTVELSPSATDSGMVRAATTNPKKPARRLLLASVVGGCVVAIGAGVWLTNSSREESPGTPAAMNAPTPSAEANAPVATASATATASTVVAANKAEALANPDDAQMPTYGKSVAYDATQVAPILDKKKASITQCFVGTSPAALPPHVMLTLRILANGTVRSAQFVDDKLAGNVSLSACVAAVVRPLAMPAPTSNEPADVDVELPIDRAALAVPVATAYATATNTTPYLKGAKNDPGATSPRSKLQLRGTPD
ncbi:MAG: serine/threonine-protein kinase [Polyangiaceae bacterium]